MLNHIWTIQPISFLGKRPKNQYLSHVIEQFLIIFYKKTIMLQLIDIWWK